jgi:hypothetical protein
MTNLVELTLAVAIGMTGAFQSGLESLQNKEHEKAVAFFTQVIEAETPADELYASALYYRAEANAARGERAAALKDTGTLLVSDAPILIKRKAQALYLSQDGEMKALRPKTGPKAFMEQLLDALRKNQAGDALKRISGPLSEMLATMELFYGAHGMHRRGGFLSEVVRESAGLVFSEEQFDDTNQTATVLMSMNRDTMGMRIGLVNRNGEWSATELKDVVVRRVHFQEIDEMPQAAPAAPAVTISKEDVDEALASEIKGLIKDLGDSQASVRAAARRRLLEVKDSARPFLAERVDDPDLEIQMTIRELLR